MTDQTRFQLGWEEWLALSDLGLPAIKAKVDTGAKTSALHASVIEPFGPASSPQVRFLIQPDPNDPALEITCSAPVVDRREVISSNGDRELRYVIETHAEMGDLRWPIQLTLSNRETMTYRMLLGRAAIHLGSRDLLRRSPSALGSEADNSAADTSAAATTAATSSAAAATRAALDADVEIAAVADGGVRCIWWLCSRRWS
jgi:hypothetical protein